MTFDSGPRGYAMAQFKPTRALLNVNFEGYKLSEEPLRSIARALPAAVGTARLRSDQLSFQHVRAFSLHNHLVADPFDDARAYWYGEDDKIYSARFQVCEMMQFRISYRCTNLVCFIKEAHSG